MKGKVLWDSIEQEARRKFGKNDEWKLCTVDLVDEEIARVRLRLISVVPGCDKSVTGLVVYRENITGQ